MIGFYGGSFDPIHFGHLNLAIELKERCGLDEVWFCPANISPYKQHQAPQGGKNRLKMIQMAIRNIPGFKVLDLEILRAGPSYTVDTLEELIAKIGPGKLRLILGEDALQGFFNWKDPQKIIEIAPPLVGARASFEFPSLNGDPKISSALKAGMD